MGSSAAKRRENRQIKRQVAMSTRDTKYANQKGGVQKPQRRRPPKGGGRRMAEDAEDEEESIAVIRGGQAVWAGADERARARVDADEDDDADGGDFSEDSAFKKLRALKKKHRRVVEMKQRRKRGEELNGHQLELIRKEKALLDQIARFEAEAARDEEEDDVAPGNDNSFAKEEQLAAPLSGSRLEQRRALKRQRHLEKLAGKKKLKATP